MKVQVYHVVRSTVVYCVGPEFGMAIRVSCGTRESGMMAQMFSAEVHCLRHHVVKENSEMDPMKT